MRSPKAKYRMEINFVKPLEGVGSVMSFNDESIDALKYRAQEMVKMAKCAAHIVIMENEATYPKFDWRQVEVYKLDKDGKADIRQIIGKRIAAIRNELGLSQQDVADRVGMRQPHIARIEAGRYSVGIDILGKIAAALGKRVDLVD